MSAFITLTRGAYSISTDPDRLDAEAVHAYLTESYWAQGRSLETVRRALDHSLCFGLYHDDNQIGLARVITDYSVFAYLCDIYILDAYQGNGLGTWLIESALAHPDLNTVRKWTLVTRDAHAFYAAHGFVAQANPGMHMELIRTTAP